jgi:YgiT-type zinc finger domain-containing protein
MNARCPLCGGIRTDGTTTLTAELGFGIVVVWHVPARVCAQCGEEWLADATASRLEAMIASAQANQEVVEVAEWQDRAA